MCASECHLFIYNCKRSNVQRQREQDIYQHARWLKEKTVFTKCVALQEISYADNNGFLSCYYIQQFCWVRVIILFSYLVYSSLCSLLSCLKINLNKCVLQTEGICTAYCAFKSFCTTMEFCGMEANTISIYSLYNTSLILQVL